jgi:hypothetical protein
MPKMTLQIDNHDQPYTVSEMRKRLAQVLSKLDGGQEVSFSFSARFENYTPAPAEAPAGIALFDTILFGARARPEND